MDNLKHACNIRAPTTESGQSYYNPKKAILFWFWLSVFSFSVYEFAFSMQVFDYNFDKNHVFLVCNGLLFIIVGSSGLIGNSPPGSSCVTSDGRATLMTDEIQKSELNLSLQAKAPSNSSEEVAVEVDHEEQGSETGQLDKVEEEEEEEEEVKEISTVQDHEGDKEEEKGVILTTAADHEEKELEGIGLPSAEELNKKCEEFIRKMKGIEYKNF